MKRTEEWYEGYKQASMDLFDDGWIHALKELAKMIEEARAEGNDEPGFDTVMQFIEELK